MLKRTLALAAGFALTFSSLITQAADVLRVSAIPDEAPTELQRKFKPLGDYLAKATGLKVEFTPVTDYAASVEGLVNKKIDMVWFGGFTFVQAKVRSGGKVIPLVQREEDEKFRSVFITADPAIQQLADLKGKDVSFGSQSSTSGHLMPRSFLLQAGVNPEKDFKRVAYSGAHDATIAAVASGKVQAGALNISVWDKLVAEKKVDTGKVSVFYTTPTYYDYNWTVHADMPAALREKIAEQNHAAVIAKLELEREIALLKYATEQQKTVDTAKKELAIAAMGYRQKSEQLHTEATLRVNTGEGYTDTDTDRKSVV